MPRKVLPSEVRRFLDAWFALRQYIQAANFNRFQGTGLSATQFMTLNLLPPHGDLSMGELARRMNLKPSTVAKTVDSLEARVLVKRVRSVTDKRSVLVTVTKAGMQLQNAAQGQFQAQVADLFRAMLPPERDALILGLESITRAAASSASSSPTQVPQVSPLRPGMTKRAPSPKKAAASDPRRSRLTPRAGAAPPASRNSRRSPPPKS